MIAFLTFLAFNIKQIILKELPSPVLCTTGNFSIATIIKMFVHILLGSFVLAHYADEPYCTHLSTDRFSPVSPEDCGTSAG